jgi:DNA-binding transcriptional MerR regulator
MKHKKSQYQTISQFAELCGTTRQTLQYYDKIGLLHPLHIGEQGYRYYDQAQRYDFQLISTLKQSGCSLSEIHEIMKTNANDQVLEILAEKKQQLNKAAKKVNMFRTFLDYTINFLNIFYSTVSDMPVLIDVNQHVGVYRYTLKQPAKPFSSELKEGMLEYNSFCSANENIQQYPYGFLIPEEEFKSGRRRVTHIICMCHGTDLYDVPATVRQGKYIMLKKSMFNARNKDREEAYDIILRYMADNRLQLNGETYEVPADIPKFMRREDCFHVLILVPVTEEENQ